MDGTVNVARILDARANVQRRGMTPVALELPKSIKVAPEIVIPWGGTWLGMIVKEGKSIRVGGVRDPDHWPAEMEWEVVQ